MNPLQIPSPVPLLAYLIFIMIINPSSPSPPSSDQLDTSSAAAAASKRDKRSYSYDRSVEVFVVADSTMSEYHRGNLRQYILTLMSTVSFIVYNLKLRMRLTMKFPSGSFDLQRRQHWECN